ncbi:uncharacterized protein LOC112468603 [Temnothorax curvispinosus]|uniref:Uncharacterized protein LOC112468603 n=1 Tax=Temnothorax curvispinosus TaxID=300111 RepID=A0A6J1RFT5_9HYME|nr:uncharacterized protein LOC112468603 [Temnothorax curvispinosus]
MNSSTNKNTCINKKEIDLALGEFFFGCNIPMNVVKSPRFKRFLQLLNSSYLPPTKKSLSKMILDKTQGSEGVLICDGWKNSAANTKNVCIIHNVNEKSIFLKSWDFTELRETSQQLKDMVNEAVQLANKKFKISIYAVVSDNASPMIAMGRQVNIWHSTCRSHSANLLAKSLVPMDFAQSVSNLLREFRTASTERELKNRGRSRIMLPCQTRWCSYRDAFRCCLKNLHLMRTLVDEQKVTFATHNLQLLSEYSFETQLQDCIILFDPICELINRCQRSDARIADACEEWLKLNIPTDEDFIIKTFQARLKKVLTPIVLAANLMHPQYQDKQFFHQENERAMALDFITEQLDIEDQSGLDNYLNNAGIFQTLQKKGIKSAQTFWGLAATLHPHLSSLARKLLKIPAASAQIERLFSNWSFVHSTYEIV